MLNNNIRSMLDHTLQKEYLSREQLVLSSIPVIRLQERLENYLVVVIESRVVVKLDKDGEELEDEGNDVGKVVVDHLYEYFHPLLLQQLNIG